MFNPGHVSVEFSGYFFRPTRDEMFTSVFPPQDYMEDVHGKEISLQYVTVKVPGQKPRGSKTIMSLSSSSSSNNHHHHHHHHSSSNGLSEHLSNISISNFQSKDKRTADKVMLTAFELLKEPSYKNGGPA